MTLKLDFCEVFIKVGRRDSSDFDVVRRLRNSSARATKNKATTTTKKPFFFVIGQPRAVRTEIDGATFK